jgi:hypothetical protein
LKTIEERKAILEKDIPRHVSHGWRVLSRTETSCKLEKDWKPNSSILYFPLIGSIYSAVFKGKILSLYIEIDPDGEIKYITDGLSSFERDELRWD